MTDKEEVLINDTIKTLQARHVSQGFIWALCKTLMSHYMLNFDAHEGNNRADIFIESVKSEVAALRISGEIQ